MITLTTPPTVNSVLGGDVKVSYNKLVLSPVTVTPKGQQISGALIITATASPDASPLSGSIHIDGATGVLDFAIPELGVRRKVRLSGAPLAAVQALTAEVQTEIEAILITLGVVAGVQSAGV